MEDSYVLKIVFNMPQENSVRKILSNRELIDKKTENDNGLLRIIELYRIPSQNEVENLRYSLSKSEIAASYCIERYHKE